MTNTIEDQLRTFGGFTHVTFNFTHPIVMEQSSLEFRSLNLITGFNSSGKTLINKMLWAAVTFFNAKMVEKNVEGASIGKTNEEYLKFILDNTFDEQDFCGYFEFFVRDPLLKAPFYSMKFDLREGNVENIRLDYPEDALPGGAANYLSTFARDFSNIERYMKTKKMLNIDNINDMDSIEKLCEWFKLYDIVSFESIIPKFENINMAIEAIKSVGAVDELLGDFNFETIEVDKTAGKIYYIDDKSNKKSISTLGAGEQSIIVMLLTTLNF